MIESHEDRVQLAVGRDLFGEERASVSAAQIPGSYARAQDIARGVGPSRTTSR
jgi:hypothetical protein